MRALFKRSLLAAAVAVSVAACGGGGGSSDSATSGGAETGETITGVASAPGGSVAIFEHKNAFEIALEFVISPVAAAITGLEPVPGASVELFRVDDDGVQVGEVLATTSTSITGGYTLTLPAGVNLAGNLIVRITGMGGTEMRAQVVETSVDISPISEFVLRKFIAEGTDLDNLTTASVVKLTGQVEEFDLTAGADFSNMLAILETEVGAFVDSQIDIISVPVGNDAFVAGNYWSSFFEIGFTDDDLQYDTGSINLSMSIADITLADAGSGIVNATVNSEEEAYSYLQYFRDSDNADITNLYYSTEIQTEAEQFSAQINQNGVLSIDVPFEEEIDGDFGFRYPPETFRVQKSLNSNVFFGISEFAAVRYLTLDTNNDGTADALDPSAREGDEVGRGFDILAKKPSDMVDGDLVGKFGRIYIGSRLNENGDIQLETVKSNLDFNEAGSVNLGKADRYVLERTGKGVYSYTQTDPNVDLFVETTADGSVSLIPAAMNPNVRIVGGQDGFINDSYDLLVLNQVFETLGSDDLNRGGFTQVDFQTTIAVKLPDVQLDLSNKRYKVLLLAVEFTGAATEIISTRYDTELLLSGSGIGSFTTIADSVIAKSTAYANITVDNGTSTDEDVTYTLNAAGDMVITLIDSTSNDDIFKMDGYMSHDGSIGVFRTTLTTTDGVRSELGVAVSELGVAVLVEVN
jgi:hypothetical protein